MRVLCALLFLGMASAKENSESGWGMALELSRSLVGACADMKVGGLAVDVGARGGTETRMALRSNFSTITVECSRAAAELIKAEHNNTQGRSVWADVHWACASDKTGTATLYEASDSSSLHARAVEGDQERRKFKKSGNAKSEVPLVVLDDLLDARSEPLCAVKVDTQGNDFAVLRGMKRALGRHRPVLYFEHSVKMLGNVKAAKFLPWVRGHGYHCFPRTCLDCHVICTPDRTRAGMAAV